MRHRQEHEFLSWRDRQGPFSPRLPPLLTIKPQDDPIGRGTFGRFYPLEHIYFNGRALDHTKYGLKEVSFRSGTVPDSHKETVRHEAHVTRIVYEGVSSAACETAPYTAWIVQPRLPGNNLRSCLYEKRGTAVGPSEEQRIRTAVLLLEQTTFLVEGLEFIHGDLKPEQVQYHELHDGQVQANFIDFGLSHDLKAPGEVLLAGTPDYIPPEAWNAFLKGEPLNGVLATPKSELFAMGTLLTEILTINTTKEEYDSANKSRNHAVDNLVRHIKQRSTNTEIASPSARYLKKHPPSTKAAIIGQELLSPLVSSTPQKRPNRFSEVLNAFRALELSWIEKQKGKQATSFFQFYRYLVSIISRLENRSHRFELAHLPKSALLTGLEALRDKLYQAYQTGGNSDYPSLVDEFKGWEPRLQVVLSKKDSALYQRNRKTEYEYFVRPLLRFLRLKPSSINPAEAAPEPEMPAVTGDESIKRQLLEALQLSLEKLKEKTDQLSSRFGQDPNQNNDVLSKLECVSAQTTSLEKIKGDLEGTARFDLPGAAVSIGLCFETARKTMQQHAQGSGNQSTTSAFWRNNVLPCLQPLYDFLIKHVGSYFGYKHFSTRKTLATAYSPLHSFFRSHRETASLRTENFGRCVSEIEAACSPRS